MKELVREILKPVAGYLFAWLILFAIGALWYLVTRIILGLPPSPPPY